MSDTPKPEMMEVRIMLLVGSNGKSAAVVEGELDWGDLADNVAEWSGNELVDPDSSTRHIVTVQVPKPIVSVIQGKVEEVGL